MQIVILLFMSVIWYEILLADTFWQNSILCVCTTEGLSTDCWWEAFAGWLLEASLSSRRLAVVPCHVVFCALSLSHVWLFMTPWTIAHQDPLSMGILQARILEWVAIPSSRGSSQLRDWTQISCISGRVFTVWATSLPYWFQIWLCAFSRLEKVRKLL